jgi:hypothetical protein
MTATTKSRIKRHRPNGLDNRRWLGRRLDGHCVREAA